MRFHSSSFLVLFPDNSSCSFATCSKSFCSQCRSARGSLPSLAAESLKQSAPFPVGVGISDRIASRPEDWPLLKREFSLVTPENCMKPGAIQSEPGVWRWNAPDAFVNFALSNNLKVVGHCLVWAKDDRTPPWFCAEGNHPATKEVLLAR